MADGGGGYVYRREQGPAGAGRPLRAAGQVQEDRYVALLLHDSGPAYRCLAVFVSHGLVACLLGCAGDIFRLVDRDIISLPAIERVTI